MVEGLEIKEYNGADYNPTAPSGAWLVAFLNYAERFDRISQIERHMETDEVFVLLRGEATLVMGLDMVPVPMEQCKIYMVKKGTWHNIKVSKDAKVLVVENSDTTRENSEYKSV